jgi:type I site-specific restriction endonuclease
MGQSRHAVLIQQRFDINYPHLKAHFACAIDFKTEYANNHFNPSPATRRSL